MPKVKMPAAMQDRDANRCAGNRARNRTDRRAHGGIVADMRADLAMQDRDVSSRVEYELHGSGNPARFVS